MPGDQADGRPKFLVEVVLEIQGSAVFLGILRIERRIGPAALQGADDGGRVADRLTIQHEERKRGAMAAAQPQCGQHVGATWKGAPPVRDALVVQGPARLLVVVRDLDVPQNRLRVAHRVQSTPCPPAGPPSGSRPWWEGEAVGSAARSVEPSGESGTRGPPPRRGPRIGAPPSPSRRPPPPRSHGGRAVPRRRDRTSDVASACRGSRGTSPRCGAAPPRRNATARAR